MFILRETEIFHKKQKTLYKTVKERLASVFFHFEEVITDISCTVEIQLFSIGIRQPTSREVGCYFYSTTSSLICTFLIFPDTKNENTKNAMPIKMIGKTIVNTVKSQKILETPIIRKAAVRTG